MVHSPSAVPLLPVCEQSMGSANMYGRTLRKPLFAEVYLGRTSHVSGELKQQKV